MSESRSRLADYRSRPPSEQLVDLHIYVVPPDIWRQKHNDVLNTDVNETISAGFIRAHPESKICSLREDIEQQLGIDLTPKDYVFMKCVGRSLTRVKPKQEYQLKVKNFLPPQAYLPEVYLLEVSADERQAFGLSSGDGSSRAQTRTSLRHPDRNRYSDDDLSRYNSRERLNVENEKIRNGTYQPDRRHRGYDTQPRSDSRTAHQERTPEPAYRGDNRRGDRVDSRNRSDSGHRDEDRRWRREQEEARRRERELERQRQEEDLRRWEDERREIQQRLEDEERDRERLEEMERQRLLAEEEMRRLVDDAKEQEEEQRKRFEQEEAQRRREFEEAQQRNEEERRQEELRRQEEEAVRRQQEEALQRQQEADDLRRIEAERERLAKDDLLKQDTDDQAEEELKRFPSPPPLLASPDVEVSEEEKKRKKAAKERLQAELEKAREQRRVVERQREDLVKKAKQLQTKTQNRRNHARDVWKKRYFEEKKKTFPLDDQSNRLRQELDQIHRKLMSTLEGPKDARGVRVAANSPSEKNNYKIQATRIQHEIEDLKRRVENSKMKLTAEMKLRNQAETELRALRAELTQKKINLTLSRSQQLASLSSNNDLAYMTPRAMVSPRS